MSSEKNMMKASIPYFLQKKKKPRSAKRTSTRAAHTTAGSTEILSNQDH